MKRFLCVFVLIAFLAPAHIGAQLTGPGTLNEPGTATSPGLGTAPPSERQGSPGANDQGLTKPKKKKRAHKNRTVRRRGTEPSAQSHDGTRSRPGSTGSSTMTTPSGTSTR
jgi:hypothetical protein